MTDLDESRNQCIKCFEPFTLTFDRSACILPYDHCIVTPSEYIADGNIWICPECAEGYYFDKEEEACLECDVEFCTKCSSADKCDACTWPYDPSRDQKKCRNKFEKCLIDPKVETYPISRYNN